ncbi:MAG TPA: phosphoenolpyruvate carboxykinase [Rhizomicrobium sp.]|jgi:phosphoenolpyruvate carboxykinase (ATP)|nr:phosphoenolpyruvate carboxykinase [Rhizomicrobium sp.]
MSENKNGHSGAHGLEKQGFRNLVGVHWNLTVPELYERAVLGGESQIARHGPLVALTGQHTGRSASDKFIVRDAASDSQVWWDNNKAMEPQAFEALFQAMIAYAQGRELFAQDLFGGADLTHRLPVRVVTEFAWHSLFIQHLLIEPTAGEREDFSPEFTIIDFPGFQADPAIHGCQTGTVIAVNFTRKLVLIGGTSYAGEMKKSVFTILNYLLPPKRVMPMHCSANVGRSGDCAIFFGLSGTGKTTLSADASRTLIGDDEHGWSENGIFNFEGGCYAKVIKLSPEAEPEIYSTTRRFGTVLENVVMDPVTRELDLDDARYTENTRAAYPIDFIPNASREGTAPHPRNVIMLTADAFGVLPPIARLTPSQAMYHFLSGFTAKIAGTEKGLGTEPQPTFSTCFGAPFMPRHPSEYGNLLRDLIAQHQADCWLVNTGWTGGAFGAGHRMPIKVTRALLAAALDGTLAHVEMRLDSHFHFRVPVSVPGVESRILNPRDTWSDPAAYDAQARKLVAMFRENFRKFESHVAADVLQAAPHLAEAAE